MSMERNLIDTMGMKNSIPAKKDTYEYVKLE